MQTYSLDDTIAAIATSPGEGGIGIIRISGQKAFAIADKIFCARSSQQPSQFVTHTVHYGRIALPESSEQVLVDEVLLLVMRAPRTYTREDVVEIHCHGGLIAVRAILEIVLRQGARLAQPGEFTKRAFLNGRIDLPQAEAVLDIIKAKTDRSLQASVRQLKGELTAELEAIREILADLYTELEAVINFPEDEINAAGYDILQQRLNGAQERVYRLYESGHEGRILREGAKVVICGKPNVGKSSLLNVLLRHPRAIVSSIAGTTRDTIEELTQIDDIPIQLIDTAGILEPRDEIEQEAVRRSRIHIEQADLVLFVLDAAAELDARDREIMNGIQDKNVILVFNKCDCALRINFEDVTRVFPRARAVSLSALHKKNILELKESILLNLLKGHPVDTHRILIHNTRQLEALNQCRRTLISAQEHFQEQVSLEFIAEEIKTAIHYLDEITGRDISQDLLDKIFASFCIGK